MSPSREARRSIDPQLVEYLVVVVPDEESIDGVLDAVEVLAAGEQAIVLDGAIVTRDHAGAVSIAELPKSLDRPALLDTTLGVLSERDLELIARAVPPASLGVVVVVEDEWARPLAEAARSAGGHVGGGERIPPGRLQAVFPHLRPVQRDAI